MRVLREARHAVAVVHTVRLAPCRAESARSEARAWAQGGSRGASGAAGARSGSPAPRERARRTHAPCAAVRQSREARPVPGTHSRSQRRSLVAAQTYSPCCLVGNCRCGRRRIETGPAWRRESPAAARAARATRRRRQPWRCEGGRRSRAAAAHGLGGRASFAPARVCEQTERARCEQAASQAGARTRFRRGAAHSRVLAARTAAAVVAARRRGAWLESAREGRVWWTMGRFENVPRRHADQRQQRLCPLQRHSSPAHRVLRERPPLRHVR